MPLKFHCFGYGLGPVQTPIVPLYRRDLWVAFGLAGFVILLGSWQMVVGVCGVFHDDGIYVITAKALAQGKGYRLIDLPNAPLQTKYPILYPALLAVIWKIWPSFPDNLMAMQGLSLLAGAGTVALAYLFLVRFGYASRRIALIASLLCATSAFFLYFSTLTLSETPYAMISILALWAIEKQIRFPADKITLQFGLGLLLAMPFLTRVIGIMLLPAGLIALYLAGGRVRWVSLGAGLIVLPWILWMLIGPKWPSNPINAYYTNYGSWWFSFGLLNISRMFLLNLLYTVTSIATISIGLLCNPVRYFGLINNIICIIVGSLTLLGALKMIRDKSVLSFYLTGCLCILLMWPWPPTRFLVPILPFLLACLLNEIWKTLQKYSAVSNRKLLITFTFMVLIGINIRASYQIGKMNRDMSYPYPAISKESVSWSSYSSIFHWINDHTQPGDVMASGLDTMVYLYTGRRSFRPFAMNPMSLFYLQDSRPMDTAALIGILKNYQPKYLIQTPMPIFSEEKPFSNIITQAILKYPGLLKTVYVGEDKRFIIYKIQEEIMVVDHH